MGPDLGQIILLVVVMAGIFVLSWLATKYLGRRLGTSSSARMKVVERLGLGRDRQIALVKVGDRHYMVGITGHQISFSQPVDLESSDMKTQLERAMVHDGNES